MVRAMTSRLLRVFVLGAVVVGAMSIASTSAAASDDAPVDTTSTTTTTADRPITEEAEDVATAEVPTADGEPPAPVVRPIVFPVVGPARYSDGFLACRDGCERLHQGVDITTGGWKGIPVVAAGDGTVRWARTGGELAGCGLIIEHEDGWTTRYAHLNLDEPGTDVEGPHCFPPGIVEGSDVAAGTLVGWIGDSGNAETTTPHLHFEIRDPDGVAIDPFPSLGAADHIDFRLVADQSFTEIAGLLWSPGVASAFVVDSRDVTAFAAMQNDVIESATLIIDADDPSRAHAALRALAPDRLVVFTNDPAPSYLDDLRPFADIVAVMPVEAIPHATDVPEVPTGDDTPADAGLTEPGVNHAPPDRPTTVTIVVGRAWTVRHIEDATGTTITVSATNRGPSDVGIDGAVYPPPDASRDGLWWLTPDGWRLTESVEEAPEQGFAYVPEHLITDPNVAFAQSLGAAPHMPVWHHQPTSRATKSL